MRVTESLIEDTKRKKRFGGVQPEDGETDEYMDRACAPYLNAEKSVFDSDTFGGINAAKSVFDRTATLTGRKNGQQ